MQLPRLQCCLPGAAEVAQPTIYTTRERLPREESEMPVKNRPFKVANFKPTPDVLLSTIHRLLGWSADTPAAMPAEEAPPKGSLVYKHLNSAASASGQAKDRHPHLTSLISHILTAIPPKRQTSISAVMQPMAPFSVPPLRFENGITTFIRGIRRLTVRVCAHRLDSTALREFAHTRLPLLAHSDPDVQFVLSIENGREPLLRAIYASGAEHVIDVANASVREIEEKWRMLRERSGERWLRGRRFRQGVVGVAKAVRPIWSQLNAGIAAGEGGRVVGQMKSGIGAKRRTVEPFRLPLESYQNRPLAESSK